MDIVPKPRSTRILDDSGVLGLKADIGALQLAVSTGIPPGNGQIRARRSGCVGGVGVKILNHGSARFLEQNLDLLLGFL